MGNFGETNADTRMAVAVDTLIAAGCRERIAMSPCCYLIEMLLENGVRGIYTKSSANIERKQLP